MTMFTSADETWIMNHESCKKKISANNTPSEFWELIGQRTFSMNPDEKVNLRAHIVPRFGSDDPDQEEAMQAFVAGLEPTFAVVRSKCPSMEEADVQLVGTELLASEILQPGRSTKKEFATWVVASLTEEELKDVLSKRKAYKETALADMKAMQEERKKREEEIEAQRQKMIEQQKKAREERSLAFNPETGKMEIIDKKEEETKKWFSLMMFYYKHEIHWTLYSTRYGR